jgi:hypothetical protein
MSRFCEDFSPPKEKQTDHLRTTHEIDSIARPHVDAHFRDSFNHRFTIANIAVLGGPDAMDDPSATRIVFQADKPGIEFFDALKGIYATAYIRLDTYAQSGSQSTPAFVHAGCNAHVNREQVPAN